MVLLLLLPKLLVRQVGSLPSSSTRTPTTASAASKNITWTGGLPKLFGHGEFLPEKTTENSTEQLFYHK